MPTKPSVRLPVDFSSSREIGRSLTTCPPRSFAIGSAKVSTTFGTNEFRGDMPRDPYPVALRVVGMEADTNGLDEYLPEPPEYPMGAMPLLDEYPRPP